MESAKDGKLGDGKIFVSSLEESYGSEQVRKASLRFDHPYPVTGAKA